MANEMSELLSPRACESSPGVQSVERCPREVVDCTAFSEISQTVAQAFDILVLPSLS